MLGFKIEIIVDDSDKMWKNILYKWCSINREYIEDFKDTYDKFSDCAYWYNERTSVGILSGAIWKCGGICLEEYVSFKGKKNIQREVEKKEGRTDLYFYIGDEEYIVEAKMISGSISESTVKAALTSSLEDCDASLHYEKEENKNIKGMGIVFIVPYEKDELKIKRIETMIKKQEADIYCSFSNETGSDIESQFGNIANNCYLIGKKIN